MKSFLHIIEYFFSYVWHRRLHIWWILIPLLAWLVVNIYFPISAPGFITRIITRIFGVAIAAYVTLHADRLVAPLLASWCSKDIQGTSPFERAWSNASIDLKLKLCVMFYLGLFASLCLAFAL